MAVTMMTLAGACSLLAALLHVGVMIKGSRWYRLFGAGERMATLAEQGSPRPTLITSGIALVLTIWAFYAWSAAQWLPALPFTLPVLWLITTIYLSRGTLGFVAMFFSQHPTIAQNSPAFWLWSSVVCLLIGLIHLVGLL
ncbi:MAG: hypothetical protein R3309_15805 [Reinekea sp.]|nr:hypothetical protein [Reinekea sp.]